MQDAVQNRLPRADKYTNRDVFLDSTCDCSGADLVQHSISDGVESIREDLHVIRAKFRPLLDADAYLEDVSALVEVVPKMVDNIEALAKELNHAFTILNDSPKKD